MSSFIIKILVTALRNLSANRDICLVTIVIMTVALSIFGLFFLIFINLNSVLDEWNGQVRLIVYLEDDLTVRNQRIIEKVISKNKEVESSEYVSKKMAWAKFKKTFSGKADVIESLNFNPLPSSLVLGFKFGPKRFEKIQRFALELKKLKGVESLEYGEKWLSRFEGFMVFMQIFLLAVGGLLGIALILIISNTIKLSVYSRRDEVELMLIIGARIQFIKGPFILEGAIQALAGGMLSILIVKSFFHYIKYQFEGSLDFLLRGINLEFFSLQGMLAIIIISMIIGCLGSWVSINHFLKSELKT